MPGSEGDEPTLPEGSEAANTRGLSCICLSSFLKTVGDGSVHRTMDVIEDCLTEAGTKPTELAFLTLGPLRSWLLLTAFCWAPLSRLARA